MRIKARGIFLMVNVILFAMLFYYIWNVFLPQYEGQTYYDTVEKTVIVVTIMLVIAMVISSAAILMSKEPEEPEIIEVGKH
ncbi:hypothetical protein DRO58_00330 [Candidatus Bathyarchaeota archaeon]|nr:MAG: hypothetical protein DRO58_00330 [Candidatus Bathyarchaeota archaeon]